MSEYLPYGWLRNVDGSDVNLISKKSEIGYFLEVDLEYLNEYLEYPNLGNKTKYVLH